MENCSSNNIFCYPPVINLIMLSIGGQGIKIQMHTGRQSARRHTDRHKHTD